jgi:hypothetical protein
MNLDATTTYLTTFFRSHYQLYEEMMRDAGSARHPPSFKGESNVIQAIRNIVHNIADNYWNLSVPEGYASPKLLLDALLGLRNLADRQLTQIEQINENLGSHWLDVISYAHKINFEVREAIDHALSLSKDASTVQASPIERLRHIAIRLPLVAHQLLSRRQEKGKPRPTLAIQDEYDVQDLLHAILKLEFDDIRPEEWCPSYAGSSKRLDFLLKAEAIVIEIKKTRSALGQKEVGEQLTIDIANYRKHPNCRHLFCLVWDDAHLISNPEGLRTDLEGSNDGFVSVCIVG